MFIPFITIRMSDAEHGPRRMTRRDNLLDRRKGGGGGGKSSGGSSSSGKSGSSGSSGSSKGGSTSSTGGKTTSVPLTSGPTANGKTSATAYGSGGGSAITIPSGQLFAGRSAGGGSRGEVFGTRTYGSGYPGVTGRGVAGRGFPFWFWPVVWGGGGLYAGTYLDDNEYGDTSNTSRVGGPMMQATFVSNSTPTTFHVLSDNNTVSSLITSIDANCSSSLSLSASSSSPQPFNASTSSAPQPIQAIQYFRASSIVLTLEGYNNSATLSNNTNTPDSPLPSGVDMTLLDCLNQTIAFAAPLVDGAIGTRLTSPTSSIWLVGVVWVVWCFSHLL